MQLKKLRRTQDNLAWPLDNSDLPIISWEECTFLLLFSSCATRADCRLLSVLKESEKRPLIAVAGFIHDVASFMDEHPGGRHLLAKNIGRDSTTAFFGGVYDHSNAAHNVSSLPSALNDVSLIT